MKRLSVFLCAVFVASEAMYAQDSGVTLQLRPHGQAAESRAVSVSAKPVRRSSELDRGDFTLQRTANAGESLKLDLAAGFWLIQAEGPGVWRSTQVISAEAGKSFVIDVWPSASVEGSVKSDSAAALKEVSLYFKRAAGSVESPESGEITAPVTDGKFHCVLPAGTFDLRLHAPSHISHFFWRQPVAAGGRVDLGTTVLKQGQAIFGRVELPRGVKADLTKASVLAAPPAMGEGLQPVVADGALLVSSANVSAAGDFQIEGLPPGPYTITARHPAKLYSDPVRVQVPPGRELQLVQPLRLGPPRVLALTISPPLDDAGQPWRVRVDRFVNARHLENAVEFNASPAGFWSSSLQPGKFSVRVSRPDGSTWFSQTFDLSDDMTMHVDLASASVHGKVTMGDKPLQAKLTFRDTLGRTATATAESGGEFSVRLPKSASEKWDIVVHSDTPPVRKTLRAVPIHIPESGDGSIEIKVPATSITGLVVDADGTPIPSGLVNLFKKDGSDALMQTNVSRDGSFALHGISTGRYSVQATAFMKESDEEVVDVSDENPPMPLTLVVKDVKKLRGIVQSEFGPVAGARVMAYSTDTPFVMALWRETDAKGVFETWLPPGTKEFDVVVAPPGFTYTIDHLRWHDDKSLLETVYQRGGTLTLPNDPTLQIVHNGGISSVTAIMNDWSVRVEGDGAPRSNLAIDMMEPGAYSICRVDPQSKLLFRATNGRSGGRCADGFLAPNGTLTLQPPRAEQAAK